MSPLSAGSPEFNFPPAHEIIPGAASIGVLLNPKFPDGDLQLRELQEAAGVIKRQITISRCIDRDWHIATFRTQALKGRYWTKADKDRFWPGMVCPLLTHQRHWLCTAAMFLMPVSAPSKVLV
jgi:hypothetical protein